MSYNSSHTEKELFNLISEGDEEAFRQLYVALKPALTGYIFKLTHSQEAVREIIQETLFRLWINRDKLTAVQSPRAWMLRLAANECFRYFRKNGLQKRLTEELSQFEVSDYSNNTEKELSYRETRKIIEQAVETLSPRQREIFQLSRNSGLKISEIAVHLGLSENYVKKTLMLSLHIIREKLIRAGKYLPLFLIWLIS